MAFWNAPKDVDDHQIKGIQAALQIRDAMVEMNKDFLEQNLPQLDLAIGINTAQVLCGNIGAEERMNYTCLGDGVNLAARLQGLNKHYKSVILIGENVVNTNPKVREAFACLWSDCVKVKGKELAVHVFEVLGPANEEYHEDVQLHEALHSSVVSQNVLQAKTACTLLKDSTAAGLWRVRLEIEPIVWYNKMLEK